MPNAAPVTSPIVHGGSWSGMFMAGLAAAAGALAAAATSMLQGMLAGTGLLAMPGGVVPAIPPMPVGGGDDEIALGSTNVFWNGLGAGRVGDPTVHGGVIIAGAIGIIIGGGTTALGSMVAAINPRCAALSKAHDMAVLSNHTYGRDPALPPGYQFLDPNTPAGKQALAQIGVKPSDVEPTGGSTFRAQIFTRDSASGPHYVVAYRGTQTGRDWGNNLQQGVGADSDEYKRALILSRKVDLSTGGTEEYTGHSLGGGMASAAAASTGRPATTFNAAGLNAHTIGGYPSPPVPVQAYYTQGEPLSALQDHRAGVLGTLTGGATLANPYLGGALGGFVLGSQAAGQPVLPQAYGVRHQLPRIPPPGADFLERHNVVAWHGLDYTLRGIAAQQKQLGCP